MANVDMIQGWNEAQGRSWAMLHGRLDKQLEPIGRAAMAAAGLKAGDRVLDVGCGCGESTVEIAARVAPGEVLGIDVSAMLLEIARESAPANARYLEADAQTHSFEPGAFDALFSRFGVMFFDDPPSAFANLRKALKPGARLAFACWREPSQNRWLSLPLQATKHLLPPLPPSDPNAPGPFAFADSVRVKSILDAAGYADVAIEPLDLRTGGDTLEDSVFMSMRIGQLGSALRQLGAPDELKRNIEAELSKAFSPWLEDGVVKMPAAAWIVSARNPS
jgi:SAM-dependent methyltransferase